MVCLDEICGGILGIIWVLILIISLLRVVVLVFIIISFEILKIQMFFMFIIIESKKIQVLGVVLKKYI